MTSGSGAWAMKWMRRGRSAPRPRREYGALARESAKLMRWLDPGIELVACGSSSRSMATFAEWERVVLEETFDVVEYISLHGYFSKHGDRSRDFMAEADLVGRYIDEIVAVADWGGRPPSVAEADHAVVR